MTDATRRRTQAERTATTRTALLEATVAALVDVGYAQITTADIARRAGVTRGAQNHHFASRVELVTESVRHLTHRLVSEYLATLEVPPRASDLAVLEALLDRLWELHRSDVFTATIELWLAARTDPELRRALRALEHDVERAVRDTSVSVVALRHEGATALLSTTMGTMRGLALLAFVHDDDSAEWPPAREHLLGLWRDLLAD